MLVGRMQEEPLNPHAADVRVEIESALRDWCAVFREVAESILDHPPTVRTLADRTGLGRATTHKLVRMLEARTAAGVASMLPGRSMRRKILEQCNGALGDTSLIDRLETAEERLSTVLDRHAPSTARLLALVGDDADDANLRQQMLRGFRSRFEIDSVLIGTSAEILVATQAFVPGPDGESIDVAATQFLGGLHQSRPSTTTEVYRVADMSLEGMLSSDQTEPIVPDLSSPTWRERLRFQDKPQPHLGYMLSPTEHPGPPLQLAFAEYRRNIGHMTRSAPGDTGEMSCPIWLPTQRLVMETWLHKDLRRGGDPIAHLYHAYHLSWTRIPDRERFRVPLPADIERLERGWTPPAELDESALTATEGLADRVSLRFDAPLHDFEVFRIDLACPPMSSAVAIQWLLATPTA
jgi:hypothetical protein